MTMSWLGRQRIRSLASTTYPFRPAHRHLPCVGRRRESGARPGLRRKSDGRAAGGGGDADDGGLRLHNSLSASLSASAPSVGDRRGTAWYACGPTVYDAAHLGHGRTYVSLDILRRVALHAHDAGATRPRPLYAMNVTDVDDKIIRRAAERGEDPLRLARRYEREVSGNLRVAPPFSSALVRLFPPLRFPGVGEVLGGHGRPQRAAAGHRVPGERARRENYRAVHPENHGRRHGLRPA